jgi:hypothetical protein
VKRRNAWKRCRPVGRAWMGKCARMARPRGNQTKTIVYTRDQVHIDLRRDLARGYERSLSSVRRAGD